MYESRKGVGVQKSEQSPDFFRWELDKTFPNYHAPKKAETDFHNRMTGIHEE